MAKIPKEAVLYVFRPETQYTCDKCIFYKQSYQHPSQCSIFGPAADIKPHGSCGFWIHRDPQDGGREMPWIGLVTKEQSGYVENATGFSCKRCEYYSTGMDCEKVDKNSEGDTPGIIHPNACCNRWEPDSIRSKMSPKMLEEIVGVKKA